MNKLISFILLISMVMTGLGSFDLFYKFSYSASAVLTIASFLSVVFCIYMLTRDRKHSADPRIRVISRH